MHKELREYSMKPLKNIVFLIFCLLLYSCDDSGGGSGSSSSSGSSTFCETGQVVGGQCQSRDDVGGSTGLSLLSSNVSSGQTVDQDIIFSFTFSEPLADYSVISNSALPGQSNTVILKDSQSGEEIGLIVHVDGPHVTISPFVPLDGGRVYHLTFKKDIEDINGEKLEEDIFISFGTNNSIDYGVAGDTVVSWEMVHNPSAPVSHFILLYGSFSSVASGQQDMNFEWPHQKILKPSGLRDDLEGTRSYHSRMDNSELPGIIPGIENYFVMQACNAHGCSPYSEEVSKYFD